MILGSETRKRLYRLLSIGQIVFGAVSVAVGAALKSDPSKYSQSFPILNDLLNTLQANAFITIPISTLALGLFQLVKQLLGPPVAWLTIDALLDDFRNKALPNCPSHHLHRVTLFRHRTWAFWSLSPKNLFVKKWPWTGWLVPVERSGDVTQSPRVIFHAPKDDPKTAEGIAGHVWKTRECIYISELPDLAPDSSDKTIKNYASKTKVSPEYLKKKLKEGKEFARSFWGIHVECKGKIWGVIIIDSRNPTIVDSDQLKTIYRPIGACLDRLIEHL